MRSSQNSLGISFYIYVIWLSSTAASRQLDAPHRDSRSSVSRGNHQPNVWASYGSCLECTYCISITLCRVEQSWASFQIQRRKQLTFPCIVQLHQKDGPLPLKTVFPDTLILVSYTCGQRQMKLDNRSIIIHQEGTFRIEG